MKILHIITNLKPSDGGLPLACLEYARILADQGHQVSIYTTDLSDNGQRLPNKRNRNIYRDIQISYLSSGIFEKYPISFSLARTIKKNVQKFDIVHVHGLYYFSTIAAAHYCSMFKVPYVISIHGALDPYLRKRSKLRKFLFHKLFLDLVINKADGVHYTTEIERAKAHAKLRYRSPSFVAGLGINLDDFERLPPKGMFRMKYGVSMTVPIILFLGRINFKKGLDLLVRSFRKILDIFPDVILIIAGPEDPGYGIQVRKGLSENGILEKTIFTGLLLGDEKLAVFNDADIFVLPSQTENFGIAIAEAMACRLPVITTNQVNIWEKISSAKAGIIINCVSGELTTALLELLDQPSKCKAYGSNGRKLVEEAFNWNRIGEKLSQEYNRILDKNRYTLL